MNNVVPLDDLFRKRLFCVPDYQRGYFWEEQQVEEFLEDLELFGPQRYHYTGTVVLQTLAEYDPDVAALVEEVFGDATLPASCFN